jgi:hypothetical protein
MASENIRLLIVQELGDNPELSENVRLALVHGQDLVFLGQNLGCEPSEMMALKRIQDAHRKELNGPEHCDAVSATH